MSFEIKENKDDNVNSLHGQHREEVSERDHQ